MSDILAGIAAYKREEIAKAKRERPLSALEREAKTASAPRGFLAAIERRLAGGNEDPKARARLVKAYSRVHSPDKVGAAIVRAIAANRAVVPVGFESVIGWYVHRLAPVAVQQVLARLSGRR